MKITQIFLVSGVKSTSVSAELRVRAGHSSALCWPFQPEALTEPRGHRRRPSDPVTKSHRNQDRQNHAHSSADTCLRSFPRDVLKKVSRGLSRVEAGNPGFPRLVQVTSGGFSWWL